MKGTYQAHSTSCSFGRSLACQTFFQPYRLVHLAVQCWCLPFPLTGRMKPLQDVVAFATSYSLMAPLPSLPTSRTKRISLPQRNRSREPDSNLPRNSAMAKQTPNARAYRTPYSTLTDAIVAAPGTAAFPVVGYPVDCSLTVNVSFQVALTTSPLCAESAVLPPAPVLLRRPAYCLLIPRDAQSTQDYAAMSASTPDITRTPTMPYIAGSHTIETLVVAVDIFHNPASPPDHQLQRPPEVSPQAQECKTQDVTVASTDSSIPGTIRAKPVERHQKFVICICLSLNPVDPLSKFHDLSLNHLPRKPRQFQKR